MIPPKPCSRKPNALPIVITDSPIIRSDEVPISTAGQGGRVDLGDGQVHHGSFLKHSRRISCAVEQLHDDTLDFVDDMMVGEDIAAAIDNDAASHAAHPWRWFSREKAAIWRRLSSRRDNSPRQR